MTKANQDIDQLTQIAKSSLEGSKDVAQLEAWRVEYLGRKGKVPLFLRNVKNLPQGERAEAGKAANILRQELEATYREKQSVIATPPMAGEAISGQAQSEHQLTALGHLHPLTATLRQIRDIFAAMGFTIVEAPDIEEARYNFDNLNIDVQHPARAETDTFYIKDHPDLMLRTHVSNTQSRGVLDNKLTPPFKMMYYGASFRSEKEDATHLSVFQQYEFMVVSETVNLSDLKSIIETVYSLYFGKPVKVRFRPAYFPFVEPGLEVDMEDKVTGKGGWLEMAGAGMVHPNVLKNLNIDSTKYQGIALGGGLDRLAMLKYNIPDIRHFYSGNTRFLKQF